MKKINLLLFALFLSIGVFAQKGHVIMTTPNYAGIVYNVSSLSPNGKWACGVIFDGMERGFAWNLTTGEIIELSLPSIASAARSISDEGVVAGYYQKFDGTLANRPFNVYGTWKDGVWTELETKDAETGASITLEGNASTISRHGEYVGGIARSGKKYKPVVWENGKLSIVDDIEGAIYGVSEDGNLLCGWTTHEQRNNRTSAIWTKGTDGRYVKYCVDLDSPYAVGPFAVATGIAPNKKYVIASNSVFNVETGDTIRHDLNQFTQGFDFNGITNEGVAYGFSDDGDSPGGPEKRGMMISLDRKITYIREYLIQQGVNLDKYPYVQNIMSISEDGKTYALSAVDETLNIVSIIVKFDPVNEMPPVSLSSRELEGLNAVSLTWKAPVFTASAPAGYNIYRNGTKINKELVTALQYTDSNLEIGKYTYNVTAVYEGGAESEKSMTADYNLEEAVYHGPSKVRAFSSALNDVRLIWENPYTNLPALRYYENDEMFAGLGGGDLAFECAILLRAEELKLYKDAGYRISQISFVPKSRQNKWTVNFYEKETYLTPFYSEEITSDNLDYGKVNYYTLKNAVEIPEGKDIIMSISVDVTDFGGYDIMGMSTRKADPGYSDLIREEGKDEFYSLYDSSMNSEYGPMEFNARWAMGMGFAKGGEAVNVKQYVISADGEQMGTAAGNEFRVRNLADGNHKLEVAAEYEGGKISVPTAVEYDMTANKKLCTTVTPNVVPADKKATLTWDAPAVKDESVITYANNISTGGILPRKSDDYSYTIASVYKGNMLLPFENFEVTAMRFYPLCDADFTFHLLKDNEEVATAVLERGKDYKLNKWSSAKLDKAVKIDRRSTYMIVLDCFNCTPKKEPVGIDNQPGFANMSDLMSMNEGLDYSSLILDAARDGNWMMGMEVASINANEIPVEGYNIYLNNEKNNSEVVTETTYELNNLEPATYNVNVNPIYPNGIGEKKSEAVTFVIDVNAIDEVAGNTLEIVRGADQIMVNGADVNAIVLFDMNGAKVAESNSNVVSLASVNNGIYVMKIMTDGKCISTKVSVRK